MGPKIRGSGQKRAMNVIHCWRFLPTSVVGDVEIRRWEDDYIDVCGSVVVWQCGVDYIDV